MNTNKLDAAGLSKFLSDIEASIAARRGSRGPTSPGVFEDKGKMDLIQLLREWAETSALRTKD